MGLFRQKMINPIEGSHVPLLLNTKTGEIRFDADDPAINWKASMKADATKRRHDFDQHRDH